MEKRIFLLLFVVFHLLQAAQVPVRHSVPPHPEIEPPWFTGPLLAPSTLTVPPGHFNIQPYIYATANIGRYDNNYRSHKRHTLWNNTLQIPFQVGITSWMDVVISPVLNYNYSRGAAKWVVGDFPLSLDFQLLKRNKDLTKWETSLLFRIQEVVPIGKYRNLDPKKYSTDIGGEGSWQTNLILSWGNLFYLGKIYFINWRTALQYSLPASLHVTNLNAYGGGPGTRGTVYPGKSFSIDTAVEITLSQNWVFAMDVVGNWSQKTKFSGVSAISNSLLASVQYSLAPALEYNWNDDLGIIFGCWFTVAGKNTAQFVSSIASLNYFY